MTPEGVFIGFVAGWLLGTAAGAAGAKGLYVAERVFWWALAAEPAEADSLTASSQDAIVGKPTATTITEKEG